MTAFLAGIRSVQLRLAALLSGDEQQEQPAAQGPPRQHALLIATAREQPSFNFFDPVLAYQLRRALENRLAPELVEPIFFEAGISRNSKTSHIIKLARVQAFSPQRKQLVYLEIDVLDTDRPGQRPIALRLSTLGKDQGWVGDRNAGNWSWYTVQLIRSDETMVHEWRSHDNEMGVSELRWQTGDFIDLREYEVAEGDVFRVVLNAQYGAWACEAAEAVLRVFTQL